MRSSAASFLRFKSLVARNGAIFTMISGLMIVGAFFNKSVKHSIAFDIDVEPNFEIDSRTAFVSFDSINWLKNVSFLKASTRRFTLHLRFLHLNIDQELLIKLQEVSP